MAEIVASRLGPAIELGKCIAQPIQRQFNYLCCFNGNIQNLKDEAKKLDDAGAGLQMQVTTVENNGEEILPAIKNWLKDINEIQEKVSGIESEIRKAKSGCSAVKSRYSLSKRAKKTTEAMKQLREVCPKSNEPISNPPPPASMVPIPLGTTYEFESRKHIEEGIMVSLRGKNVNMIGICGMGGVGKTTMAKRVMKKATEEHLFDEIVMAVVSQQEDMPRIQDDIAKSLGLKLEEGSLSSKAHNLRTRLVSGKKILIVLDDVWKNLKLEDLGIPCESGLKGCTILLTSRDRDVLNEMGAQKVCGIQTLNEVEAWSLFKEKGGACVDDQNLQPIAQKIVKECKGLPIALVNVAMALKVKKYKSSWEDALKQLKSSNPVDMPKILEHVYSPLKLSYNFLESQHPRSVFLLCCLFPEDYNIPLEYLTFFAMGLRMFEDVRHLGEARNRICSLVEMLRSRFLLLEGWNEYYVRMHDVVRDVAIFIATEERRIKCSDCTWISPYVGERIELPVGSIFPNLRLLLFNDWSTDEECQINDSFFEGKMEVIVLSMESHSLKSLPHTTQLLKNLHTLLLQSCTSLETMCGVGELVNLEILICRDCNSIKELPSEMMRLKCLKLLEISQCRALEKIAPGVISSLDKLEELKIVESFRKWEAEDKEKKNARLSELESLSNLTCLEIEIEDSTLAAQHISLPPSIVKYNITIGGTDWDYDFHFRGYEKKMSLHLPREITLGNWIHECVRSVECMCLYGNGSNGLDLGQAHQNIRWLSFENCSTTSSIVGRCGAAVVFPHLETMQLLSIVNLEEICDVDATILEVSPSDYSFKYLKELTLRNLPALKRLWKRGPYQDCVVSCFSNLSSIEVTGCRSLRNLFPLSTARDCFPQLESLHIQSCDMMEQVFLWNEEENEENIGRKSRHTTIMFPELKSLRLDDLGNLTAFCKGIESIEFSVLTEMVIDGCPRLKGLVSSFGGIDIGHDDDHHHHSSHLLCKKKVSIGNLRKLRLENASFEFCPQIPIDLFSQLEELEIHIYGNIKSLFKFSVAQNLANLKLLIITRCKQMVKVIESDDEGKDTCQTSTTIRLFPNLNLLYLIDLPELKSFCNWRCDLELPKVEELEIVNCPKMGRFNLESLTTPNLKTLKIVRAGIVNTKYSNDALQIESLLIGECSMMEQVFLWSEEENEKDIIGQSSRNHHHITFPKLKMLVLHDLPRLTTFCKGIESIEFPLLTKMKIWNCLNLKNLVSAATASSSGGVNNDDDHSLHLLCRKKVSFGNLRTLQLQENASFEFCPQIPIDPFSQLEELEIHRCGNIKSLFSFSVAQNLANLKLLRVTWCKQIVKVIEGDDEGKDACQTSTTICLFPNLKELHLCDLPELNNFCSWRCDLELPKVEELLIVNCPKMGRFNLESLTIPNLKTLKIAGEDIVNTKCWNDTLQIESLEIGKCSMMKQVFLWSEEENEKDIIGQSSRNRHHVSFPKLKTLFLYDLPRLTTFCKGIESIEFPLLTQMEIFKCPNLKSLVSPATSSSSGGINNDDDHSLHLLCKNKVSIGNLRKLQLENASFEFCPQIPMDLFSQLEELKIHICGNIKSLFKFSIAQNLANLKLVSISWCEQMVKVIEDDDEGKDACQTSTTICLFPNLKELHLCDLPELNNFCSWRCDLELPKVEELEIVNCPKMGRFNLESLTTPNLRTLKIVGEDIVNTKYWNDTLQIESLEIGKCSMMKQVFLWSEEENEKDISFPKLRTLFLYDLPRLTTFCKGIESIEFPLLTQMKIWKCPNLKSLVSAATSSSSGGINNDDDHNDDHSLHLFCNLEVVFGKLKILEVHFCDKIRSLFSSSIARDLINLAELRIERCKEMVKVIEEEEECSHESTPLFPHLETLHLNWLPKLKFFCEWRCALQLPSLDQIYMGSCSKMERFSLGSLTAPKLKIFEIDNKHIAITEDLNDVLQQRLLGVKEQSTSSKGQEGQKEKGEIKEGEEESTSSEEKD